LAKGQIASQDSQARRAERFGESLQQRRLAVGSRAVRQYQTIGVGAGGAMQKSAHRQILDEIIAEWLAGFHDRESPHQL
jgi:hypothetical protein